MKQLHNLIKYKNLTYDYYYSERGYNGYYTRPNFLTSIDFGELSLFKMNHKIKSKNDIIIEQFIDNKIMIPNTSEYITLDAASKLYIPYIEKDDPILKIIFNNDFYMSLPQNKKYLFFYLFLLVVNYNTISYGITIKKLIKDIIKASSYYTPELRDSLLKDKPLLLENIKKGVSLFVKYMLMNNIVGYPETFPVIKNSQSRSNSKQALQKFLNYKIQYDSIYNDLETIYSGLHERIRIPFEPSLNKVYNNHLFIYRNKMFSFKIKAKLLNSINNLTFDYLYNYTNLILTDYKGYEISPHELYVALVIKKEKYNDFIISRLKGEDGLDGYVTLLVDERLKTPTTAKKHRLNEIRSRYVLKLLSLFKGADQEIIFTNNLINKLYEKII